MKLKHEYSGKTFFLEPYNTSIEKDILIAIHMGVDDLDTVLDILGTSKEIIDSLTYEEKIAMLYKYRTISVGEEIPLKYRCIHCSHPNDIQLNIETNIISSNITNDKIKDAYKILTTENVQDFLNVDIDDLDLDEYETLYNDVKEQVTKFNFIKSHTCLKCRKNNKIDITQNVIENMSEDSLVSLYQTYNDLTFFGKYTKQDIDSLYPFERSVLIGLLNKTREDLTK